jgi:putative nucleotidyltransferase with HDIG domain
MKDDTETLTTTPESSAEVKDTGNQQQGLAAPRRNIRRGGSESSAAHPLDESTHSHYQTSTFRGSRVNRIKSDLMRQLSEANKELWLIMSMLVIAVIMNNLVTGQRMVLGFYTLPTLFSAYFYGKRHATLTAFASVFLVGLLAYLNPNLLTSVSPMSMLEGRWYDITAWGGILVVTAYAMGTLHERQAARTEELRQTYHALLHILRHFVSKDKYTENHSYRVSLYATRIAATMGLTPEQIEDVRSASLLHGIGKLETSRQILYKAAKLTREEYDKMRQHADRGASMLETVSGPLRRIIPIILAHHDKFDGSGYHPTKSDGIPIEARIISVADVYDSLTSDRPYRKAMSPFDAREVIARGAGTEFDPDVVNAFLTAFGKRELEIPELVL